MMEIYSGPERRKSPRREAELQVRHIVHVDEREDGKVNFQTTKSLDIGGGGLSVYVDSPYAVGTKTLTIISLPDVRDPLIVNTTVISCGEVSGSGGQKYKLRLQYVDIKGKDFGLIMRFVGKRTREKKKILVADDDPDTLSVLKLRLEPHNYEIITACNGWEAVRKAREEKPDLIILDIRMPVCDGPEAFELLKQSGDTSLIPVVFLTAYPTKGAGQRILESGNAEFIRKPWGTVNLLQKIKQLLGEY